MIPFADQLEIHVAEYGGQYNGQKNVFGNNGISLYIIMSTNLEVFRFVPDYESIKIETVLDSNLIEFEDGSSQRTARWNNPIHQITHTYLFDMREKSDTTDEFVDFLNARLGQEEPFVVPGWREEAELSTDVNLGATQFPVDNVSPFTATAGSVGNLITVHNRVTDAVESFLVTGIPGNNLNVDGVVGATFNSGDKISIAYPVRFAQDSLDFKYPVPVVHNETSITFIEVPRAAHISSDKTIVWPSDNAWSDGISNDLGANDHDELVITTPTSSTNGEWRSAIVDLGYERNAAQVDLTFYRPHGQTIEEFQMRASNRSRFNVERELWASVVTGQTVGLPSGRFVQFRLVATSTVSM